MSMGEADAKFPGQSSPAIAPSPTRENPGQVYPKSDPKAAPTESVPGTGGEHNPTAKNVLGNPYAFQGALRKLDSSLTDVISTIESEESSVGASEEVETLVAKFKGWREELGSLLSARSRVVNGAEDSSPANGGMFAD